MDQNWFFTLIYILPVLAAALSLLVAYHAWRNKHVPGSINLTILMLSVFIWSILDAIEKLAPTISSKIIIAQFQYLGIASIPALFLIFCARYTLRDHWLSKSKLIIIGLVPILTIALVATNNLHHLHWAGFSFNQNTDLLTYHYGPWFWINTAVSYFYLLWAFIILIRSTLSTRGGYRAQSKIIILAAIFPWVANLFYILGLIPIAGLDPTPLTLAISGFLLAMNISEIRLIDPTPIARTKLVDTIQDAIIVIDFQGKIADLNPAACQISHKKYHQVIKKPATVVLKHWPYLDKYFKNLNKQVTEIRVIKDIDNRIFDTRISTLSNNQGNLTGHLLILRDITDSRKAQEDRTRLSAVIEQATESILIMNIAGDIVYANPFFEILTGYSPDEVLRKNVNVLREGNHQAEFYQAIWNTINQKETWSGNFITNHKDGHTIHQASTIFPIINSEGTITNFASVSRDISAQVQAEQSIRIFTDKLTTLHDVTLELSQAHSLNEMCVLAVHLGRLRLGFDRIRIWFVDSEDPKILKGSYGIDSAGRILDDRSERITIESNTNINSISTGSEHVFHQRQVDLVDGENKVLGIGDIAAVTLRDGLEIIGYLIIDNLFTKEPITKYHLDLLGLYAQTISILSTRIRVTQEISEKALHQQLLNEITHTAIQQTNFQEMIQILAIRLGELFRSDGCSIILWDEETQYIQIGAINGFYQDYLINDQELDSHFLTRSVLESGKIMTIDDVIKSLNHDDRSFLKPLVNSILGLPLIANEQKLGVAWILFENKHKFTKEELILGEQAARQVALAILKTRLLEEAELRAKEAETLRQASGAVAETLKQDIAIERILEELNRVVPYDSASVQLLVRSELEIVGERGFKDPASVIGLRFPLSIDYPNSIVLKNGDSLIIQDVHQTFNVFKEPPHDHIHGWMGIPLKVHEEIIGMLALDSIQPDRFTQDHKRLATAFADQVAIALENARLFEETQWLAIHDSLTGLFNRRHFMHLAWGEFQRSLRYETPLSVIMLDIDHFKRVNDTFGHLIGDQVLCFIADLCKRSLRVNDLVGRYGGEEFVILLPETTATLDPKGSLEHGFEIEPAKIVAERLRKSVKESVIDTDRGGIKITISLGISEISSRIHAIEQLIDQADQALLQAKQMGRDRVSIWNVD